MKLKSSFLRYFLMIFIFCSYSCTNNTETVKNLTLSKVLSFDTGMSGKSSIFKDTKTNKEYIYFFNSATDKQIKVFDLENNLQFITPLDSVVSKCSAIDDISFISFDSIVVLCAYSNKLFVLNRKGEVWRDFNLNNRIKHKSLDYYNFRRSFGGGFLVDNKSVVLATDWKKKHNDTINRSNIEEIRHFLYNEWNSTSLVRIDNIFDDQSSFQFGFKKYKHYFPKDSNVLIGELPVQTIINKSIFSWTSLSNKVVKLNLLTLAVEKEILIEPNDFRIGVPILNITDKILGSYSEIVNNNLKSSGLISRIFYNEENRVFIVKVLTKKSSKELEHKKYRPFVLMIYDENFNKVDEILFDDIKYSGTVLNTENGLLIKRKTKIKKYHEQKAIYEMFKFSQYF